MDFIKGDLIWIYPHEELCWAVGEVEEVEPDHYLVRTKDYPDPHQYQVLKSNAIGVHPSCLEGVPDLLSLGEFNEATLLHNVRVRYSQNSIYTSIGEPILISINPYCNLPIYSEQTAESFRNKKDQSTPHLFLMAQKAYDKLIEANQTIIISGESGSGKTEAAKKIMQYLAGKQKSTNSIETQVVDSNPILEAFGNAKTLRNDNSSRFGKFIQIHFDPVSLKLVSASVENYLLEKSRIVTQQPEERNYHFFYQLCAGASELDRQEFRILEASEFRYLTKGECLEIDYVDDAQDYQVTRKCMDILGFSQEEQRQVISITMGVLHLGNIDFEGEDQAYVKDEEPLQTASELLGISCEQVRKFLVNRTILDPSSKKEIVMNQNCSQAVYNRDAAAKTIYSKLFDWVIARVNKSIASKTPKRTKTIGLLDIYGFEVFEENSFEQLCINYANEKLQQHFTHHMFKLEQQEYSKEKIKWEHISYEDNQQCIDLIEKKPTGIISILDEQTKLPKGSEAQFLSFVFSKLSSNKFLCEKGRFVDSYLGIKHYAGDVFYTVDGFLEKNTDRVTPLLGQAFQSSSLDILKSFSTASTSALSAPTIATQFKAQLHKLIKTLTASRPWYIRCIKPNPHKESFSLLANDVHRQLRCAGMLESIRIRKAGYSVRRSVEEFVKKYKLLAPKAKGSSMSSQCREILSALMKYPGLREMLNPDLRLCQLGVTKVFMKENLRQALDAQYAKVAHSFAATIQKHFRGRLQRRRFLKIRKAVLTIQRKFKNWKRLYTKETIHKSVLCIQSYIRMVFSKLNLKSIVKVAPNSCLSRTSLQTSSSSFMHNFETDDEKPEFSYRKNPNLELIQTLQQEITSLTSQLTQYQQHNQELSESLEHYKELYKEAIKENKITISQTASPKKTEGPSKELENKNHEISMLNLKLSSYETQLEEIKSDYDNLKQKEKKLRTKYEKETLQLSQEVQDLKLRTNLDQNFQTQQETQKLENLVEKLETQNSSLNSKLKKAESENKALTESNTTLKHKLQTTSKELKETQSLFRTKEHENMQAVQKTTRELNNLIEQLRQEKEELEEKLSCWEVENKRLRDRDEFYSQEIQKLKRIIQDKKKQVADLETQIEELHETKMQISKENIELKSISQNQRYSMGQTQIKKLKEKLQKQNQEIEDLSHELDASKRVYSTLLTLLKFKNEEIEFYKKSALFQPTPEFKNQINAIKAKERELLNKLDHQIAVLKGEDSDDD